MTHQHDEPGVNATDAELADYYDQHRDTDNFGSPQPVERQERLDVTISVRFSTAEMATIRSQAQAVGLKPTTYIRRVVLAADEPPVDRTRLTHTVAALARDLDDLRRVTGQESAA